MRKTIAIALMITLAIASASAASLEIFRLSHPVYDEVEMLYVLEGKASPLGAKPWTRTDVSHLISRIEPSSIHGRVLKDRIESYIAEEKSQGFILNAEIAPRLFLHSDSQFSSNGSIVASSSLDEPAVWLGLGYRFRNCIALYTDFALAVPFTDVHGYDESGAITRYPSRRLGMICSSNIPFLPDSLDIMNFPNNAYLSLGFDAFRFVSGRGQIEWGNGMMGNMMLGNTLPYHDYLSLAFTGSDVFSYQMLASFFTHSRNKTSTSDRFPLDGLRMLIAHRFEFSFFGGKVLLALNEGIMYQSPTNYFDPRLLNPLFFLHNGFMAGNSNSLATAELEYSPVRNLSLYLQLAVDDLAVGGEPKPGEQGGSADGIGAMAGVRYFMPAGDGIMHMNAEFVYTSPFLYHRAMENEPVYTKELYFVSSTRNMIGGSGFVERYLSFPFGSDAIAAQVDIGYRKTSVFDVTGTLSFMAHGVIDQYSTTTQYSGGEEITHAPSTSNPFAPDESKGGVVEYTLTAGVRAQYYILDYLPVDAGLNLVSVWNMGNQRASVKTDLQFDIGFRLFY